MINTSEKYFWDLCKNLGSRGRVLDTTECSTESYKIQGKRLTQISQMDFQEVLLRHVINAENVQFLSKSHPHFSVYLICLSKNMISKYVEKSLNKS